MDTKLLEDDEGSELAIARRSLPDAIYLVLRDEILSGTHPPGDALRQEPLAKRFDVSRIPIREALNRLQADGLVQLRPRRGYVVASLDLEEIKEIFELRMVLEEHIGRIATMRRNEKDVRDVRRIVEAMEQVKINHQDDVVSWSKLNRKFHTRLCEASGRRHFYNVTNAFRDMVERYIRMELTMTGDLGEAQREHREIVDAFAQGDAKLVGQLSAQHCEHTAKRLISALEAREIRSRKQQANIR